MQNRRGRGQVTIAYLLMAAAAALLVVVLAVRQVTRATTAEVWTAKSALKAGQKIESSHLQLARVARNAIPAGAVTNPAAILGRVLQAPVAEGVPLTLQEFSSPGKQSWLSDAPEPGRSVMAVRLKGAVLPTTSLRYNDRLDIYSIDRKGVTTVVARDARYIGSMNSRGPSRTSQNGLADIVASAGPRRASGSGPVALVLSLRQQDLATVAEADGSQKRLQFAVLGVNEPPYVPVAALPPSQVPTIDLIMGSTREKVNAIQ